ncbi:hypothetical protein A3C21_00155 [Candidatus Kaiserbacteria bacterium RIFCSPHIGHO2_02_FULL_59_21]|nr:MAG: hypothetical protein A2766_00990 [Candidatus Kaiserbacteria bacterium RIFCSPHIGHO2_01_FULL_58_22]OGG67500.1 MAG: hypothetical protein A3C21_00155 [Candidatus Kaiserbacteria bacterium RIFCSPHIGHO2_02_FULL_59_21]OGG80603.1 MAG: hypothetical protein A2952_03255 [Candidatus Kaiserbacteria bacterium RIFCSPLOWO2_01_FULL_59_34]OGG86453.1 MAG: hypothetical protein A3I47_03805 [Candidatus Kaiserbacteria bacterium RIFCSPLOWO2_02_FULL_59_19]
MELRFRESALADVRSFVFHYEEAFLELYSDTGLWSEDTILESVRSNAKQLFTDIYGAIEEHLERRVVLGRKTKRAAWYEFSFRVGSRLVIVHYSENRKHNIRWVESIAIDRKPIIF